jgi:hypothetical protein
MAVQQWLRKISLVVAPTGGKPGMELSNLHVRFAITSTVTETPSTLTVRIWNVAPATRQFLKGLPTIPAGIPAGVSADPDAAKVILQAGYEGNFGIIFKGDLMQFRAGRESPADTYVDLLAADGDWGHTWGTINTTLAAGWTPKDVNERVKTALTAYGLTVSDLPDTVPQKAAPRAKVLFGRARDIQRDMGRGFRTDSYIRHGNVEWLPSSAYRPGDIIKVNSTTGMIGLPQQTNFGISVKMLLNPSVGPGSKLLIDDASIQRAQFTTTTSETAVNPFLQGNLSAENDGTYKVLAVSHEGDTRGNEWYTDAICMAITQVGSTKPGGVQAAPPPNVAGFQPY